MNIYILLPLSAFLINGFVWTFIFAQKKQSRINIAFLIYAADLAFWLVDVIVSRLPLPAHTIIPIMKIGSVFWISIGYWFLNFTYVFVSRKKDILYYFFLALMLISILISVSTDLVIKDYTIKYWGLDESPGVLLMPIVFITVSIPGLFALYLIEKEMIKTKIIAERNSLKLLFTGSIIILLLGLLSNIVIPYILKIDSLVQAAESITVIQSLFIFIAVRKYGLFTIGIEETAQELFSNMQDAVFIVDNNNTIVQANNSARMLFPINIDQIYKKNISELLPEYHFKETNTIEKDFTLNGEKKFLSIQQTLISRTGIDLGKIFIIKDITGRKKAEQIIRKSRLMLSQAEQIAHLGGWEWQISTNKVTWSDELFRIYGISPDSFKATFEGHLSMVHHEDRERVSNILLDAMITLKPFQFYERVVRPSGEIRVLYSKGIVNVNEKGEPVSFVGACLDVSEFKAVEEELRISREQLRALSASLQDAREEERLHIAREIHDELGQVLTALKIDIAMMAESFPQNVPEFNAITEELHSMENMVDTLIKTIRNISTELRPEVLDHLGLLAALEWHINEFSSRTNIECKFNTSIDYIPMNKNHSIAVFRILQEALTNVVRHSEATKVLITLSKNENNLILEISDNGKGITLENLKDIKSIGLIGMKERGFILGGSVDISGNPGKGTTVVLKMPYLSEKVYEMES